ncbi:hypothetical protein ACFVWY_25130 [Streptomyces sp. NPDC058195]|uniref:hypothetical protein n=1 Tax=Streptomyces sp. NPDC058195 TaxID=3346375 RepID=UPI0036E7905D
MDGDARSAYGLAAFAGGRVAFRGPVADVLAFHAGQGGQHGEHDAGGVGRAVEFTGEELQADVSRLLAVSSGYEGTPAATDK